MFSIAAINDTESQGQWEPLAPTKEAQEFHLSQNYHEGLLKLQAKEYDKARELFESVLKDPLIAGAQVDSSGSDGHLLQLRYLALKNLATVFLQLGSGHCESALQCYLQAAEIDTKDSVLWNQLGTLSCSMGVLSISRWAFEQGLLCSPNNWNCMEKLLEVLIAIGDEIACLSVAELILRHWPSHSRALHVKKTIEDAEPVPFAPRGIDRLEPKHIRLNFLDKRKTRDEDLNKNVALKRSNRCIEVHLAEASWAALADALLAIFHTSRSTSELGPENSYRSGDVRLSIHMPLDLENATMPAERRGQTLSPSEDNISCGNCNTEGSSNLKDANLLEEQPQERRSTRLERLRSRKPGKEESDIAADKNLVKAIKSLAPFIVGGLGIKEFDNSASSSTSCPDYHNSSELECVSVAQFVREASENYGAYHMAHLLLEHTANRCLLYQDAFLKFLELEKLIRNWGKDRSPECCLFLAELYCDIASYSSDASELANFMAEASYHLCKIVESVALDYPLSSYSEFGHINCFSVNHTQGPFEASTNSTCYDLGPEDLLSSNKTSFWVRFFWLSGQLAMFEGNKNKAYEDFCSSVSHLMKLKNSNGPSCSVRLPHCKVTNELTVNRVLYVINLLRVDFLLEKTIGEMIEKEMYSECITVLAPLLISAKDDMLPLCIGTKRGQESRSIELSALDILIKACCKLKPVDYELYLNCHRKKLQILMISAGIDSSIIAGGTFCQKPGLQNLSTSETDSRDWNLSVAEEVRAISQFVSEVKNFVEQSGDSNIMVILAETVGEIQSLLLTVMCNIASTYLCKRPSGSVTNDETEQKQTCCFVDAAIAFCNLQHLTPSLSIKTQVELMVAIHDLLAEYGICCLGFGVEGEEGTFLKFAIKHLLALDMKLKSNTKSSNRETAEDEEANYPDIEVTKSPGQTKVDTTNAKVDLNRRDEMCSVENDTCEGKSLKSHSPCTALVDNAGLEHGKQDEDGSRGAVSIGERASDRVIVDEKELTGDEREELELKIDNALDQCFFCLYGLNLRSDSSYDDDLAVHRNTSRGDYQTKEQCADVFQYILPYAKDSSRSGLVKLRRVLRAIRKHFVGPPEHVLAGNVIDKFLDDPELCEDKLSEEAGSDGFLETITRIMFPGGISLKQYKASINKSSEPYSEVYRNLYYFLAQSEETSATDKWPGFVLTKEGEEFVQQNANLFKHDLIYNPLRFESWQQLGNIYDEEVDLLLNDGSKHINVSAWRKNANLPQRVEISRRRSRRCLLMSLALAKTATQQGEIHELLALVYYDSLQNVVPFYDQRSVVPCRDAAWTMYCENSMRHFKKAFEKKHDWSHTFYMGKLSEKLKQSHDISLSYYDKAISLNPSAVDPVYRMHASRLKKLYACGKHDVETLKVIAAYCFGESTKDALTGFCKMGSESLNLSLDVENGNQIDTEGRKHMELQKLEDVWHMLYNDCLSALEICVEGDLKHFHKARYMLAQGLYRRGEKGDFERAKDELSFCFKSSRSSFTINMWEIDGMVKKARRSTGNRKVLEVSLPESSRKFITCIRKYLLFYLKLLEEAKDTCTLDRAYISLRADKRFSLCIEDLVPVALARHIRTLISSLCQAYTENATGSSSLENLSEKLFALFMEQGNLWPEICNLPEIKTSETLESSLYSYLHRHIASLEKKGKLEALEAINEKIRKRFKNPKLSNSNSAKVCRHALVAWCRSLITRLASITPLQSGFSCEIRNPIEGGLENSQLLYVDLQTNELWNSSFEDLTLLKDLETEWSPSLSNMRNIPVSKVSDENLETVTSLLRSSYNFYRESSCGMLQSGVNLYLVPLRLVNDTQIHPRMEGVETLDLSIPRKLLLWAYALLHGRCANISAVVKFCEENAKSKLKKGAGALSAHASTTTSSIIATHSGDGRDGMMRGSGSEADMATGPSTLVPDSESTRCVIHHCNTVPEKSETPAPGGDPDKS